MISYILYEIAYILYKISHMSCKISNIINKIFFNIGIKDILFDFSIRHSGILIFP